MATKKLFQRIAELVVAIQNCERSDNIALASEWAEKHADKLAALAKEYLPSGSGFDNGTTIDEERTTNDRLVLVTSFHHLDEHGGYCGWSEHEVIVTPSLLHGFHLRVTGRNKRGIKEYIGEHFEHVLSMEVET